MVILADVASDSLNAEEMQTTAAALVTKASGETILIITKMSCSSLLFLNDVRVTYRTYISFIHTFCNSSRQKRTVVRYASNDNRGMSAVGVSN